MSLRVVTVRLKWDRGWQKLIYRSREKVLGNIITWIQNYNQTARGVSDYGSSCGIKIGNSFWMNEESKSAVYRLAIASLLQITCHNKSYQTPDQRQRSNNNNHTSKTTLEYPSKIRLWCDLALIYLAVSHCVEIVEMFMSVVSRLVGSRRCWIGLAAVHSSSPSTLLHRTKSPQQLPPASSMSNPASSSHPSMSLPPPTIPYRRAIGIELNRSTFTLNTHCGVTPQMDMFLE